MKDLKDKLMESYHLGSMSRKMVNDNKKFQAIKDEAQEWYNNHKPSDKINIKDNDTDYGKYPDYFYDFWKVMYYFTVDANIFDRNDKGWTKFNNKLIGHKGSIIYDEKTNKELFDFNKKTYSELYKILKNHFNWDIPDEMPKNIE